MKNVENMPVASSPRMALEPVSVRIRRIRSGMIGLASFDSRTMNDREQHDRGGEDGQGVHRPSRRLTP